MSPIADRLALQDFMARYAITSNTFDLPAYAALMTDDVSVTGFIPGPPFIGKDVWMAQMEKNLAPFIAGQHLMTNFVIEQDGDRAKLQCSFQAIHALKRDPKITYFLWGIYREGLVRQDGEWLINYHSMERIHSEKRRSL